MRIWASCLETSELLCKIDCFSDQNSWELQGGHFTDWRSWCIYHVFCINKNMNFHSKHILNNSEISFWWVSKTFVPLIHNKTSLSWWRELLFLFKDLGWNLSIAPMRIWVFCLETSEILCKIDCLSNQNTWELQGHFTDWKSWCIYHVFCLNKNMNSHSKHILKSSVLSLFLY